MNNNIHWRLQICSHKEIFTDRDTAMKYIRREFLPDSMVGEPTLYFYGDSDEPNTILAFGVGDRRIATIDVGAVSDRVDDIETSDTENFEKLDNAIATLKDVINAAGLTFDENKIQNQVTYEPDAKDELIGDTNSLGEAIAVISKFAQDSFKSTNLIPVESKSIAVSYTTTDKGMELKPSVKFSSYGDTDSLDDNNNILGLKPDGIYATVNLEYDPEKCELSFVTSGMKDGKFMDDANRKVIKLGEHTQYTPDNNGYNVNLVVDKDKNTISANVKISEDPNNILSVQDEKLFVDGRATNIKYKSGTVYSGINQLETSFNDFKDEVNSELDTVKKHISDVEENTTIEGDTTDTMVITATKETNVGYRISGGVRLGNNKTIIHKDGGLEVDLEISCDIAQNKLIVRIGNVTKEIELPGVDFIDNAYYDSVTEELVIEFNNGNTVRIPMSGLITIYTFENNTSSPVVFQVNDNTRSIEKVVTTAFRLASNDNILSINGNGELIAPKSTIDNAVKTEQERAQAAEKILTDNLNAEIERAKAAEQKNANDIITNTQAISDTNTKVEANTASISLLNADDNTDGSVKYFAKQAYDLAVEKVEQEQSRAEGVENGLAERISTLEGKVTDSADGIIDKAKRYADAKIAENYTQVGIDIANAKSEAISAASEDATNKADKALEDAKKYTDNGLALKANSADVYTKQEIIDKGFLTSVDLSGYAKQTDVVAETNRAQAAEKVNADAIDALEDRASAIENNITLLQTEDKRLNLIPNETNSFRLNISKSDSGTAISGDVKLNTNVDNIIKLDGNGLYSSVILNYDKAQNSLELVVNGISRGKLPLSNHSLVQEGYYDPNTQSIILTIVKDGGDTDQITIPVGDIINEWKVDNGEDNPIVLNKTTGVDGVDVLTAKLSISSEPHNAVLNNNGTLYVSNEASKLTALWSGDEITIQKAIENLKTETDKVEGLVTDVDTLKADMSQAKNDITVLQGDVNTLKTKVEQNTSDIAVNKGSINSLTQQVSDLSSQVTNLTNSFQELSTKVESYEERVTNLETGLANVNINISTINQTINELKEQIGEPEEGQPNIYERLKTIEEIVNNLIDFGNY